jgi:tetratricopeptide (TPR) repeat protein
MSRKKLVGTDGLGQFRRQPSQQVRLLSLTTTTTSDDSPYAADFRQLLQHLQDNQGELQAAYWENEVLRRPNANDAPSSNDDVARTMYLARRLRDSIAVPTSVRPKALALWEELLVQTHESPATRADVHTEVAIFLQQHGNDFAGALQHLQHAIDGRTQAWQAEGDAPSDDATSALAAAYLHLGLVAQQGHDWTTALPALTTGLRWQQKVMGEAHESVADTWQNVGHLHGQLQDFQQAGDAYHTALQIYQTVHGEEHVSTAGAYHNYGLALQYQAGQISDPGQIQQLVPRALAALQTALQVRGTVLGRVHPDTAASHLAIAQFLSPLQQKEAALEHYEAAASIWQAILEDDSTPVQSATTARRHLATIYNNAGACRAAEDASAALVEYERAQQSLEPLLNSEQGVPPSLMLEWVATLNNVGMAQLQLQLSGAALQAHQSAKGMLEASLGQSASLLPHLRPALAQTYGSLGKVYQAQGDWETALGALQQAHELLAGVHTAQPHADVAASHNNLGLVYTQLQKYDEALTSYRAAQALFGQTLGTQHAHTGSCAMNTGLTLVQQDKLDEAALAFGEARDIWAVALGTDHAQTETAEGYANDPASALLQSS